MNLNLCPGCESPDCPQCGPYDCPRCGSSDTRHVEPNDVDLCLKCQFMWDGCETPCLTCGHCKCTCD
jgi:hypothetical protein